MRETISIDKNFMNNTCEESIKMKRENSEVRGIVTVGLYDENNKLQREVKTENCVMDLIKWFGYDVIYGNRFMTGGTSYASSDFTNQIFLTDGIVEEDPLRPYFEPNETVIGFCGRTETYSGNDTKKGSYNSAESRTYTNEDGDIVYHRVYDFPTHACNGDISSIVWSSSSNGVLNIKTYDLGSSTHKYMTEGKMEFCDATYVYTLGYLDNGKNLFILRRNKQTRKLEVFKFTVSASTFIGGCNGFKVEGNVAKVLANFKDSTVAYLELNLNTKTVIKEVYKLEKNIPVTGDKSGTIHNFFGYMGGAEFLEDKMLIPVYSIADSPYVAVIEMDYNLTSGVFKTCTYETNIEEFKNKMKDKNLHFMKNLTTGESEIRLFSDINGATNGYVIDVINKVFKAKYFNKAVDSVFIGRLPVITMDRTISEGRYIYEKLQRPAFARTKLPNKITKTNTNTMKVQYDFIYKKSDVDEFIK